VMRIGGQLLFIPYTYSDENHISTAAASMVWQIQRKKAFAYNIRDGSVKEMDIFDITMTTTGIATPHVVIVSPAPRIIVDESTNPDIIVPDAPMGYRTYLTDGKNYVAVDWKGNGAGELVTRYGERLPRGMRKILEKMEKETGKIDVIEHTIVVKPAQRLSALRWQETRDLLSGVAKQYAKGLIHKKVSFAVPGQKKIVEWVRK